MNKFIIVLLMVAVAGAAYYLGINYQRTSVLSPTPAVDSITQTGVSPEPQLVGGDKDEHGCIGSAGYTWCSTKDKCIRVFEEDCLSEEGIKAALASKYNKQPSDVYITISQETPKYAKGGVRFDSPNGEGGMFLAAKANNTWTLVFDGNGSVDCTAIKQQYDFPPEMLTNFCD